MENKICQDQLEGTRLKHRINMTGSLDSLYDKSMVCGNKNHRTQWKQDNR